MDRSIPVTAISNHSCKYIYYFSYGINRLSTCYGIRLLAMGQMHIYIHLCVAATLLYWSLQAVLKHLLIDGPMGFSFTLQSISVFFSSK